MLPFTSISLFTIFAAFASAENISHSPANASFHGTDRFAAPDHEIQYLWPHAGQTCYFRCKEAGFCCGSGSTSGNQMISCVQACIMRSRGTTENELVELGGLCQRTSSSGCSLDVNGYSYSFCGKCSDVTEKCPHGVESSSDCYYGARTWTNYLLSTQQIVNAEGCDCAWIPKDNCKSLDFCAEACRKANPWGSCGYPADLLFPWASCHLLGPFLLRPFRSLWFSKGHVKIFGNHPGGCRHTCKAQKLYSESVSSHLVPMANRSMAITQISC